ncbi:SCO family protein [Thalassotalea profundi]|uniref:Photosynthetic protein synthase I n=1 Tax=Thalassotalea profundi TaxID=2036687 RepID=A0ABQ3J003_9GAMM|nr:SCO family protein [Thalassotalea profundi]GHE96889.1 photosynthetic protein synthase I [Thalassotalea profundi]
MNKLLIVIVAVVALTSGLFVFKSTSTLQQPEFALYYQQAREIQPFSLVDHHGNNFSNKNLEGRWSWMFFGYTSCPDVCPTTLQELNFIYDDLEAIAPSSQVVLVSVDPKRDTQEKLAQYIAYFNAKFQAVTAGHDVLYPFARNLGLMYAIADDSSEDSYLVDHSGSIVLLNPKGKIAAIFKPQHELGQVPSVDGSQLVSDFTKIVKLYTD